MSWIQSHSADLQINSMPQLPILAHSPTNPIPRLENRDSHATLQQDIRTPQPSEPSAHNTHTDRLFRSRCHTALEHVLEVHVPIYEALSRVQVLQDARRAGGRAIGVVLACLHRSWRTTGSARRRWQIIHVKYLLCKITNVGLDSTFIIQVALRESAFQCYWQQTIERSQGRRSRWLLVATKLLY